MANRRIVGRCRAAYTGPEGEEYRKQLNAEKLYALMDRLGFSDSLQQRLVHGHNVLEARL